MIRSFYGSENPNLTAELVPEIPAVFNWALDGLDRLRFAGVLPAAGIKPGRRRSNAGPCLRRSFAFVKGQSASWGKDHSVPVDELWTHWKAWCEIENCRNGTKSSFARNLKAAFPEISDTRPSINGKRVRVYQGITLRTEPDEEPEEPDPFPEALFMEVRPVGLATVQDVQQMFGGEVADCHQEGCQ